MSHLFNYRHATGSVRMPTVLAWTIVKLFGRRWTLDYAPTAEGF